MAKKYEVELSEDEREQIKQLLSKGLKDEQIADTVGVHVATVERIRKRLVLGGLEHALKEDPRPGGQIKLDGEGEAILVALACSQPPLGHTTWTMQMLADRWVEMQVVEAISDETVRQRLKKTN